MGTQVNRVYLPYGVGQDGVIQIVDRQKLLIGCTIPTASPNCAKSPTQADLLYPQIGFVAMNPENGGHSAVPVLGVASCLLLMTQQSAKVWMFALVLLAVGGVLYLVARVSRRVGDR